jgi:hypothetical protein
VEKYYNSAAPKEVRKAKAEKEKKDKKKKNAERYIYYKHNVRVSHKDTKLEEYGGKEKDNNLHEAKDMDVDASKKEDSQQDKDEKESIDTQQKVNELSKTQLAVKDKIFQEMAKNVDQSLTKVVSTSSYIGMIDRDSILIQFQTSCILLRTYPILKQYLYQRVIDSLYAHQKCIFTPPLPLKPLLYAALCHPEVKYDPSVHINSKRIVENAMYKLEKHRSILSEMLSIDIKSNHLHSLPKLSPSIPAYLSYLPVFLLKLSVDVQFSSLDSKIEWTYVAKSVGKLLADYYAKFIYFFDFDGGDGWVRQVIEGSVFPEVKRGVKIGKEMGRRDDYSLVTLTTNGNLYRIFERW